MKPKPRIDLFKCCCLVIILAVLVRPVEAPAETYTPMKNTKLAATHGEVMVHSRDVHGNEIYAIVKAYKASTSEEVAGYGSPNVELELPAGTYDIKAYYDELFQSEWLRGISVSPGTRQEVTVTFEFGTVDVHALDPDGKEHYSAVKAFNPGTNKEVAVSRNAHARLILPVGTYDIEIYSMDLHTSIWLRGIQVADGGRIEKTVQFSEGDEIVEAKAADAYNISQPQNTTNKKLKPLNNEILRPTNNVLPASINFGSPYIGCQKVQTYTISNTDNANADYVINGFEFTSQTGEFSFNANEDVNGPLPWTLHPEEEVEVYIRYIPINESSKTASLSIMSNSRAQPHTVRAIGAGTSWGEKMDVFESNLYGKVDILFTLDRSASMPDDNALVVANFGTFINELVRMNLDYHIAVAVEDDGCVLGSEAYIDTTFSSSNAVAKFENMADIYNECCRDTERGFTLVQAALKSSNIGPGGCNEGLYREDAALFLIHVSDEPEQSVNPYTYYVGLFQGMKDDPKDVVINAVAGDYPGGCKSASPGTGYHEAAEATGGLFLSICATDWGAHFIQLAQHAQITTTPQARDTFELTQLPVPELIEVSIDGITTTTGWQYDPSINSVVFDTGHIPAFGSQIEIKYHLMPDCEG